MNLLYRKLASGFLGSAKYGDGGVSGAHGGNVAVLIDCCDIGVAGFPFEGLVGGALGQHCGGEIAGLPCYQFNFRVREFDTGNGLLRRCFDAGCQNCGCLRYPKPYKFICNSGRLQSVWPARPLPGQELWIVVLEL